MKKTNLTIVIFLALLSIIIVFILDLKKTNMESDIKGKDTTKEEYIYKDDLLSIGYNIDDVNLIASKINLNVVKKYFLTKKYGNLSKYLQIEYFNPEHIERYDSYSNKHKNYSMEEVILYVEIGLDYDFYSNINEINNYKDPLTLVNKYNKLPDNYSFDDLVTLNKPYSNDGNKKVRSIMYDSLISMINDAKKEHINLTVISAYRTNENQDNLFNNSIKKNGLNHALLYSAKKGHSEHQLGLAVDFNSVNESFDKTKEFTWLYNNSYKYGFTLRYPKGKEFITGYGYEPWHYRYLGIDTSTKLFIDKITYEEYLIKYKK